MNYANVRDLNALSVQEARRYMQIGGGVELDAAIALASDRSERAGSTQEPDAFEVHHALFLLRRALGLKAPSFDNVRCGLRQRAA